MGRKYCVFFIEVLPGSFSFKYKNYLFFFFLNWKMSAISRRSWENKYSKK